MSNVINPYQPHLRLGAFALFAFCGQWGGPKKISYASEPSPEEIVNASESFARRVAVGHIPGQLG